MLTKRNLCKRRYYRRGKWLVPPSQVAWRLAHGVLSVLALKLSHAWWHPEDVAGKLQDVAHEAGWESAQRPGKRVRIIRTFRDGSTQEWWAVEIVAGPYGLAKQERAIMATTDPQTLPDLSPSIW